MNKFMKLALDQAREAFFENNVPVGAVIVKDNKIISFAHNKKNSSNISVYHAEILSIIDACKKLGTWYLEDCVMYVTLKPCNMCASAIAESRIKKVFYLIDSNYTENMNANINNIHFEKSNESENKYLKLLSDFFKNKRLP